MSKKYFVTLTGSKNNAGDFLIRHRALGLLRAMRPDREVINFDSWVPFSDETLNVINKSQALLLTGGPALQRKMYPQVYPLMSNLSDIKVPILTMGIGSKALVASDTYNFSNDTEILLKKINESGYFSSVRDFHSQRLLKSKNLNNFEMTGCPVFYDIPHIHEGSLPQSVSLKRIAFSLGVSFVESESMKTLMKNLILEIKKIFPDKKLEVVFHHSVGANKVSSKDFVTPLFEAQVEFSEWLKTQNVACIDVSGGHEKMMEYYRNVDFHVGFRVHAHILMCSWSKPSILLSEDSRAVSFQDVLEGSILQVHEAISESLSNKILSKLKIKEPVRSIPNALEIIINKIQQDVRSEFENRKQVRDNILKHFVKMKNFIEQLP